MANSSYIVAPDGRVINHYSSEWWRTRDAISACLEAEGVEDWSMDDDDHIIVGGDVYATIVDEARG